MERTFYIAGVQFHEMKNVISDLNEGQTLSLVPDPENKFDPNAVCIKHEDTMLGFVPKTFSSEIAAMLELCELKCTIEKLNRSASPWEQCRVVISDKED